MDGEKPYINYGVYRGYLFDAASDENEEGIELLTSITIIFSDLNWKHPVSPDQSWVSEYDVKRIVETYKGKYGTPTTENKGEYIGTFTYKWKVGSLEITLYVHKNLNYFGKQYLQANAEYSYNEKIQKELKEKHKKQVNDKNLIC